MMMCDETAFVGVFPDRKARTGSSPGFNHLRVGPWVRADPFQQVEDESLDGVRHNSLLAVELRSGVYRAVST
jgi:hypothetical protein